MAVADLSSEIGSKINQAYVYVLHKTLNLVISHFSFREDSKKMYQNV